MTEEVERRHPLAECEHCPLGTDKSATFVPGYGPEDAKVAIVGEAPGVQEAYTGKPFTGPSGQLLNIVLERNGLNREEIWLTNACLCRPKSNATPPPTAIRACRPRLDAELEGVETVVAMGNTAAAAILKRTVKITEERIGPAKQLANGKRFIATIHPAACLRSGDFFPYLLMDMGKVNGEDRRPWEPPAYKVWDTERDALLGLALLAPVCEPDQPLVVDIETGYDKEVTYQHRSEDLLAVGLCWTPEKAVVLGEQALKSIKVRQKLGDFLRERKCIAHNGKYDFQELWAVWDTGYIPAWFDTMLASYCLDERPGTNSLDYNGQEIIGTPDWKGVIRKYINPKTESYAKVPRDVLYEYCAFDCSVEYSLFQLFEPALVRSGQRELQDMLVMFSNELMYVEKDGMGVDVEYNAKLFDEYLEVLDPIEESLKPWVDNPRSPKQVKEALSRLTGSPVERIPTTDQDALERWREVGLSRKDPELAKFCTLMLEYRLEHKRYSTYVKGIRKRLIGDRVYPTYTLHSTVSGRTSCRNPNLQNIPRFSQLRKQFVPREGNVLVQGDYAGAELRVVAVESGDEHLLTNLDDWNKMVARQLYGDDYDLEQYTRGKAMVHGTNYGREAPSIAVEYNMDISEAERYQKEYLKMIPGVVAWQKDIEAKVLKGEFLQTKFNRKRRFWLVTKENRIDVIKEALSFVPQSTASDINMNALCAIRQRFGREYNGVAWVRIPVHDSILAECRKDLRDEIAVVMREEMEKAALLYTDIVPFKVDLEWGLNWGEKEEMTWLERVAA